MTPAVLLMARDPLPAAVRISPISAVSSVQKSVVLSEFRSTEEVVELMVVPPPCPPAPPPPAPPPPPPPPPAPPPAPPPEVPEPRVAEFFPTPFRERRK